MTYKKDTKSKIVIFSDVHYSVFWDKIQELLSGESFFNANQELANLITKINEDNSVLGVINNGDSVDYYFTDYASKRDIIKSENNWDKYNRIIANVNKPYFETIGNHDYRLAPYNIGIYGLAHIGISGDDLYYVKRKIGHTAFRWLGEWSSLSINESKFDPLNKSNGIRNVSYQKIGDFNFIFINTGSDAYVRMRNTIKYLFKIFLKTYIYLLGKKTKSPDILSVDVDGILKKDINDIHRLIDENNEKDILFCMHAPLINPRIGTIGKKYNLKKNNFHLNTTLQGIADDVIFNGGGAFLKLLSDKKNTDKNFTIIASHIHNPKYILIGKHTRIAEEVTLDVLNAARNNPMYIKHLTTLALGLMSPESNNERRGYLELSEDGFEEIIVT